MKATDRQKKCLKCGRFFRNPYGIGISAWGRRKYCSYSCSTSATTKGQHRSPGTEFKKGHGRGGWRGTLNEYKALHYQIRKSLGMPTSCESCHKSGLTGKKIHWANKSHEYKKDLKDWIRLCVACHKKYDYA